MGFVEMAGGLGGRALLLKCKGEGKMRACVRRVQANRFAKLRDRARPIAFLQTILPCTQGEGRCLTVGFCLVQTLRLRTRRLRACAVSRLLQHLRETQERFRHVAPQPRRGLEFLERFVDPARLLEDRPAHVVGLSGIRLALDCFTEERFGFIRASGLPQEYAESKRRVRQGRTEFERTSQRRFSFVEPVLLLQRDSEIVKGLRVLRFFFRQRLQHVYGAREIALMHQRRREVQAGGRKAGVRRDDFLKHRRGLLPVALCHQREAKAVQCFRSRIEIRGALQMIDTSVDVPLALQGDSELKVRGCKLWIQPDSPLKLLDPFTPVLELHQRQAEVVPRLGVFRPQANRHPQGFEGALQIARPPSRRAKVILRVEELRIELRRLAKRGKRLVCSPETAEHEAKFIVRPRVARRSFDSALISGQRPLQVVFRLEFLSQLDRCSRRARLCKDEAHDDRNHPAILASSFFGPPWCAKIEFPATRVPGPLFTTGTHMTRRTRLVGVAFILTSAAGWNARAQSSLDRRVGADENGRPIVVSSIGTHVIGPLARAAGVPVGIELAPGRARKTRPTTLTGLTVRQALDVLAAVEPGYEWRDMNGAFVLRTSAAWGQRDHPLHRSIQPIALESTRARHACALISAFLGGSANAYADLGDTTRFSVRVENGTVLDLLSATAAAHGSLGWVLEHTTDARHPYVLMVMFGANGSGSLLSGRALRRGVDVSRFADPPIFSVGGSSAVLDRIVGIGSNDEALVVRGAFPSAVWDLSEATNVPMGIEFLGGGRGAVAAEIPASGRPLRDVLNDIVTFDPRYEWREMDGVIAIRPVRSWNDAESMLFRRVTSVQLTDVPPQDAVERLARQLGYAQRIGFPSGKLLSVDIRDGTTLDLLNAILREHGGMTWTLRAADPDEYAARSGYRYTLSLTLSGGRGIGFGVR